MWRIWFRCVFIHLKGDPLALLPLQPQTVEYRASHDSLPIVPSRWSCAMHVSLIPSQTHTASETLVPLGSPRSQWSASPRHSEPIGKKTALSPHIQSDDYIPDATRGITWCPCLQSVAYLIHLIAPPRGPLELRGR